MAADRLICGIQQRGENRRWFDPVSAGLLMLFSGRGACYSVTGSDLIGIFWEVCKCLGCSLAQS